MNRIIIDGREVALDEGEPIKLACETLGVPFGCESGICATCVIVVELGMENLLPPNDLEKAMRLRENERLACQARMRAGDVTATW